MQSAGAQRSLQSHCLVTIAVVIPLLPGSVLASSGITSRSHAACIRLLAARTTPNLPHFIMSAVGMPATSAPLSGRRRSQSLPASPSCRRVSQTFQKSHLHPAIRRSFCHELRTCALPSEMASQRQRNLCLCGERPHALCSSLLGSDQQARAFFHLQCLLKFLCHVMAPALCLGTACHPPRPRRKKGSILRGLTVRKIAAHQITASDLNTFTITFPVNTRMKFVMSGDELISMKETDCVKEGQNNIATSLPVRAT